MQTIYAFALILFAIVEIIRFIINSFLKNKLPNVLYTLAWASTILSSALIILVLVNRFIVRDMLVLSGQIGNFLVLIAVFIIIILVDICEIKQYQKPEEEVTENEES